MTLEMLAALGSWGVLNKVPLAKTFTEDELKEMLDWEVSNNKRWNMIERLHQTYTTMRAKRERIELKGMI